MRDAGRFGLWASRVGRCDACIMAAPESTKELKMSLRGKTALITGSSRGIGRGIALKLAQHGVKTAIHYHTQLDAANETLAKVHACGGDGFVVQAGVTRPDEIRQRSGRIAREL